MDYTQILEGAQALAEAALATGTTHPAESLGLDERCGPLVVGEDWIAVSDDGVRRLRYYGGFEYIDEEYITMLGNTTFYSIEADRVLEAMTRLDDLS
jgi:imidazolonepropionase-like amidohydrolase